MLHERSGSPAGDGGLGPRRGVLRRRRLVLLGVVLALHAVLAWLAREPGILTGQDDAEYITLAKSLRQGGYHELFREDAPLHAQYPPGYPALLGVWGALFGDGFDALTALSVLLSAASLALAFGILRGAVGEDIALLTVLVLAVNPQLIGSAGAVMSEVPYLFLSLALLALLAREERGRTAVVATMALAIGAALTRTAGVTLVAALGLYWVLARRWRAAGALVVAAAVFLGGWILWTMLAPEQYVGASYIADFGASGLRGEVRPLPLRPPGNLLWYGSRGVPWMLSVPSIAGTPIDNAAAVLLITVTLGAGLLVFARRWRAGLIYAFAYAGLLSVWVWRIDRFLVPVLFLIVGAMLAGAWALGARLGGRWPALLPAVLAVVLAGSGGLRTLRVVAGRLPCDSPDDLPPAACLSPDQASWVEAVRWARTHTGPDAVLLAAKSAPFWLYTGRKSVGYEPALAQSDTAFLPWLRERGARYILLGSLHFKEPLRLLPLVAANCSRLDVAAVFPPRTWLFSLLPDSATAGTRACDAVAAYREANAGRVEELTR
jgi:MFS family permease